ncbi:protein phosphatase 2c [Holotrichia oblita]|uniref:Protein phosphatase 2c n=1 Tax=Holotrichia oblita TaxID=644536 RepID=A0ACB9T3N4_HOLOL|nr:protein phosphatase 2c [Holotrichia oblita]
MRENVLVLRERQLSKTGFNMQDLRSSLPSFGDSKNYKVEKWIQDLEDNRVLFGWSPTQMLLCATTLLKGTAKPDANPAVTSWEEFRTNVQEEFGRKFSSATIHQVLVERKRGREEGYQDYLLHMKSVSKQGDIEEEALIEYIIDGIPDNANNKIELYGAESKGKAVAKTKGVTTETPTPQRPKRKTKTELGQILLSSEEEEEDEEFEDEKDLTFEGPDDSSDDDDDDDEYEEMNDSPRTSEDSSEEDEDDERKRHEKFCKSTPFDSAFKCGTTAVVALLKGSELYVANAGDSRCVLCRNGKAIAMSFDHNPFLAQEEARIKKGGGYVGKDGRVNGGLNLSRALGDHSYKQNKELSDHEQIITALPDVKTITIKPGEDEFMILACDGIWNSMSRQKVVDFVRTRIEGGQENMSAICEELFDNCLSPHTFVDGSGCDNMTAVIVQFKHKKSVKTSLSDPDLEEESISKKMKSSNDA